MNERIKELIEECTDRHFSECIGGFETFDKEKFAELIVKECLKLNSKELSITAIERLLPLYREHFGIEE